MFRHPPLSWQRVVHTSVESFVPVRGTVCVILGLWSFMIFIYFFYIYIYHFPFLLPGHFCCISAFWLHVSFMLCCSSQILVWAVLRVTQSLTMKVSLCAFSICIPAFLNIFFIFILIASFSSQHCLPLFTDRYFASVCLVFSFTRCSKSSALINSIFGSCFFLYNWMPVTISTWAVGYALIHHA